jgi:prophage antirepressor-like protein
LLKAGEPWFVAADVCRALQLASHKGSHAAHLDKLDDDEKLQISREAIVAATMTPGLKVDEIVVDALARLGARAARADDPLGMEKGPMAWLVSESGLHTLILRSREATTRGTLRL